MLMLTIRMRVSSLTFLRLFADIGDDVVMGCPILDRGLGASDRSDSDWTNWYIYDGNSMSLYLCIYSECL